MKLKRLYILLSAFVVIALALTGCGSAQTTTSTIEETVTGETTTMAETSAVELDPYEISIVFPGAEQKDIQLVTDQINKIIQPKINATVKFTTVGFASWAQQSNLMLASNEKIDLLWTASFFNYNGLVSKQQLLPLDELIEKYGANIKTAMQPEVLNAAKVNNKIYGIPSVRDFAGDYGFMLRKDIADELNIDLATIKTLEDMTNILKTIKEKKPDLTPFASTQTITIAELLGSGKYDKLGDWMGVTSLDDNSLKIVNYYETPEYANIVKVMRQWYQAGYFSKDAATTKETPDSLVKADKAFAYAYQGKPGIATQESAKTGKDMVYVPITPAISTTSNITGGMASIPYNCKDPERVMMLLDLWYSDKDLVNTFDNGIEGVHYVKQANGLLNYPAGVDAKNRTYVPITYRVGNNFLADVWEGNDANIWNEMKDFNNTAVKSPALGFSFDSTAVKTEVAAVTSVISEYRMGLETGTLDPEKALPEFIAKLKDSGIDKIIAEKQTQIQSWKADQ